MPTVMTGEFGHRLLADEARAAGQPMADRTAWRITSANGWWSSFGKKRAKDGHRPGPPVHDDLCAQVDEHGRTRHVFAAQRPDALWLTDITEHSTAEGKVGTSADNAMAESFNASLKRETLAGAHGWPDALQARRDVFAWITRYNTRRRHSTCGYLSPVDYENAHHKATVALAA